MKFNYKTIEEISLIAYEWIIAEKRTYKSAVIEIEKIITNIEHNDSEILTGMILDKVNSMSNISFATNTKLVIEAIADFNDEYNNDEGEYEIYEDDDLRRSF